LLRAASGDIVNKNTVCLLSKVSFLIEFEIVFVRKVLPVFEIFLCQVGSLARKASFVSSYAPSEAGINNRIAELIQRIL
jgi:hypothetical protein